MPIAGWFGSSSSFGRGCSCVAFAPVRKVLQGLDATGSAFRRVCLRGALRKDYAVAYGLKIANLRRNHPTLER